MATTLNKSKFEYKLFYVVVPFCLFVYSLPFTIYCANYELLKQEQAL